jgi:hypothetical protein
MSLSQLKYNGVSNGISSLKLNSYNPNGSSLPALEMLKSTFKSTDWKNISKSNLTVNVNGCIGKLGVNWGMGGWRTNIFY